MNNNHLNIQSYRTADELRKAHPEVRSWAYLMQVPRGMAEETAKEQLRKRLARQGKAPSMVYRVGDFFMAPQVTTPTVKCICPKVIGDNGPCSVHGEPPAYMAGRA